MSISGGEGCIPSTSMVVVTAPSNRLVKSNQVTAENDSFTSTTGNNSIEANTQHDQPKQKSSVDGVQSQAIIATRCSEAVVNNTSKSCVVSPLAKESCKRNINHIQLVKPAITTKQAIKLYSSSSSTIPNNSLKTPSPIKPIHSSNSLDQKCKKIKLNRSPLNVELPFLENSQPNLKVKTLIYDVGNNHKVNHYQSKTIPSRGLVNKFIQTTSHNGLDSFKQLICKGSSTSNSQICSKSEVPVSSCLKICEEKGRRAEEKCDAKVQVIEKSVTDGRDSIRLTSQSNLAHQTLYNNQLSKNNNLSVSLPKSSCKDNNHSTSILNVNTKNKCSEKYVNNAGNNLVTGNSKTITVVPNRDIIKASTKCSYQSNCEKYITQKVDKIPEISNTICNQLGVINCHLKPSKSEVLVSETSLTTQNCNSVTKPTKDGSNIIEKSIVNELQSRDKSTKSPKFITSSILSSHGIILHSNFENKSDIDSDSKVEIGDTINSKETTRNVSLINKKNVCFAKTLINNVDKPLTNDASTTCITKVCVSGKKFTTPLNTLTATTRAPSLTATTQALSLTVNSQAPSLTVTSQAPFPTPTTQAPSPTPTTQDPSPTATTQDPSPTATTQDPSPTATTQASSLTTTTQAPSNLQAGQASHSATNQFLKASTVLSNETVPYNASVEGFCSDLLESGEAMERKLRGEFEDDELDCDRLLGLDVGKEEPVTVAASSVQSIQQDRMDVPHQPIFETEEESYKQRRRSNLKRKREDDTSSGKSTVLSLNYSAFVVLQFC